MIDSIVERLLETSKGGIEVITDAIIQVCEEEGFDVSWSDFDTIFERVCVALEDRKLLTTVICR